MIAKAIGAQIIAVDIDDSKLAFAKSLGATIVLNAHKISDIPSAIQELTKGGVSVSMDALGSQITCQNSVLSLRKRGKHIQIGLMTGKDALPQIPMGSVISKELEIIGSHGMQAHQYPAMLDLIFQKNIPFCETGIDSIEYTDITMLSSENHIVAEVKVIDTAETEHRVGIVLTSRHAQPYVWSIGDIQLYVNAGDDIWGAYMRNF